MAIPYPTLPGDVDRAVADDHAAVLRLLDHLEVDRGDRRTLADQLSHRLSLVCAGLEEAVLPALGDLPLVEEARVGLQNTRERLAVLDSSDPGSPEFEQALLRLIEGARLHTVEIEEQLLPALRATGADLRTLGRTYASAQHRAPSHPHPDLPAQGVTRVVASLVDRIRDRSSGRVDRLATDASGLLDGDAQAVVDAYAELDPHPLATLDPAQARSEPSLVDAVDLVPEAGEVRDVLGVPVRLYRPPQVPRPPVLVFAHAGGGVLGGARDATAQALAEQGDCLVVSVGYRLAPEHPFPAGHDDVLTVLEWVLEHAAELGGHPGRVAVAGESIGANLVASACLRLRGERRPAAALLITPLVTAAQDTPSMWDSADAVPIDRPGVSWFLGQLFADATDAFDPRFDLLAMPASVLAALPPTHVVTAERDPLRDQGERFAEAVAAAGVATTLRRYAGVPHGFFGLGAAVQASVQAQVEAAEVLRGAFATDLGGPTLRMEAPL